MSGFENRKYRPPGVIKYWELAQLVERLALNQQVRGSKPLSPAIDAYSKIKKKDNNFSFQEEFKWFESIKSNVSSYMGQ